MLDETPKPDRREAALRLAIEQFYFGYRAFTVQPDRILAERGLGRVHHRILYFVGRNPRISVNALLGMLSVSKQALNAPLRQLMDMQLVMIDTAAHDKRVRELSLTPDGAELEAQLTGTQMQQLQTVFAQVGAEAEAGWHEVMRSLSAQS
ncbi:winged helix-turn-helix transcriptional regulator [Methylomonas sp. LW13]|nr:MarR family transcriptional regulator [Methylomonas sp. Kb3]QBC30057.1 winged helix-turn-helix transcriptional regulator [Methylomonas sp. LW13]